MKNYLIEFPDSKFESLSLPELSPLPEVLTIENSPVLFGCRNGICATCLIEVIEGGENLPPPGEDERDTLEMVAPHNPHARLACQLKLNANIKVKKIDPE